MGRHGTMLMVPGNGGGTMANKVGNLIKKARTDAGLTQEQLAKKVKNVSASDISKAERGELKLSQDALKQIAKATGVTQKSLLDAAAASTYKNGTSAKSSTAKKSTADSKSTKKTDTKKSTTKKTTAKGTSGSGSSMKVSATERKLVELYREADSSLKKKVMELLKKGEPVSGVNDVLESLVGTAIDMFSKK